MPTPLDDVCRALLPRAALPLLAPLRCQPGVRIALADDDLWVWWEAGHEAILAAIHPLPGVKLFAFRQGRWHGPGQHLPALDLPQNLPEQPLDRLLFPAPIQAIAPIVGRQSRLPLVLVPDEHARAATGLLCGRAELASWADSVPSARLASLRAAQRDQDILVVGQRLPQLPSSQRFWGHDVLLPLGYRLEPPLPASAARRLLSLDDEECALFTPNQVSAVPLASLRPLSRGTLKPS